MTWAQFFAILQARRWLFAAVLGAVLIPTVVLSLVLPKRYTATASVLLDVKPDPMTGAMSVMQTSVVATQIDIMKSDRVGRRVLQLTRIGENAEYRQRWQQEAAGRLDIETWLVELLGRQLDIKPSRESSVIGISYTSTEPATATAMANAYAQAYLDTVLDLRVEPAKQFSRFFSERAKELRSELEQAQSRLSAFQRANGAVMSDEKLDIENQRLHELSTQLVSAQSPSADAGSRQGVGITSTSTRQREAQARLDLDAQRAKVLKMKQVRDEGMLILRDVESTQLAYEQVRQRLTQSSLESQVTATNISLLNPATPPFTHSSPRLALNSFMGLLVGLALAVGVLLIVELRDRRLRLAQDVRALLDLPTLGYLPKARP